MSGSEFLLWVRGPGLAIASTIFLFGMTLRLLEIFLLGTKQELAKTRDSGAKYGFRTMFSRFLPADRNTAQRSSLLVVAGYLFHVGLLAAIFLHAPHIELIDSIIGLSWPALPSAIIDLLTGVALVAMLFLLWRRVTNPVANFLSTGEDYLVWALSFLPLLTGYMSYHHLFLPYDWLLGLHIFSVEALMVLFPFTKLTHAITTFVSRWYTGARAGEKGMRI